MKKLKKMKILSICISLGSVLVFVYFLIFNPNKCIILTEPNKIIRYSEVFLGFLSVPFLILIIIDYLKEVLK